MRKRFGLIADGRNGELIIDSSKADTHAVLLTNAMHMRAEQYEPLAEALQALDITVVRYSPGRQQTAAGFSATTISEERTAAQRALRKLRKSAISLVPVGYSTSGIVALELASHHPYLGAPILFTPIVRLPEQFAMWEKALGNPTPQQYAAGVQYKSRVGETIVYDERFGTDFARFNLDMLARNVPNASLIGATRDSIESADYVRAFSENHGYDYHEIHGNHYVPLERPQLAADVLASIIRSRVTSFSSPSSS